LVAEDSVVLDDDVLVDVGAVVKAAIVKGVADAAIVAPVSTANKPKRRHRNCA